MKKHVIWLLLVGVLTACGTHNLPPTSTAVPPATPIPTAVATETAVPTPTAVPATATPIPPTATPEPDLALRPDEIFTYPVPNVFAGERVTFQIVADVPTTIIPEAVSVHILVDGSVIASGNLSDRNRAGNPQGLFKWVWDTTDLTGPHQVDIVLDRDNQITEGDANEANNAITLDMVVLDPDQLASNEANAVWVTAENNCCLVHVVSGTAAYRDLPELLVAVDTAVAEAASKLNETPNTPLDVYLIDRVLGQGGYAGSIMVVSYLDRAYAASDMQQILIHEAVHVLDRQFAPRRIAFLAEGLAVWASGGHYKPENITTRAAALVRTNNYVPLTTLVNDFYPVQHEIGYLQAAGFVDYLVQQGGWQLFKTFYQDVTADDAATQAAALDLNLQQYYGRSLATIEADWLSALQAIPQDIDEEQDLIATLRYYNVMRHYQTIYDPTAYFMTAWFPYPNEVRSTGNPADLTRHPQTEINITLEVMLHTANQALRARDFNRAHVLLDSIERVLNNDGAFIDPLANSYLEIIRAATNLGYEVQQVALSGQQATLLVTPSGKTNLTEITMRLRNSSWILTN